MPLQWWSADHNLSKSLPENRRVRSPLPGKADLSSHRLGYPRPHAEPHRPQISADVSALGSSIKLNGALIKSDLMVC
jgi:hypothetical protein